VKRARAASELNSDTETSADQDKSGDSGEADQWDCRIDFMIVDSTAESIDAAGLAIAKLEIGV